MAAPAWGDNSGRWGFCGFLMAVGKMRCFDVGVMSGMAEAMQKQHPFKALSRQFLAQHGRVAGVGESGFEVDDAVADELGDFAVEVLHAFGGAGLHGV